MAIVVGDLEDGKNVPTRLHRHNLLRDTFGGARVGLAPEVVSRVVLIAGRSPSCC